MNKPLIHTCILASLFLQSAKAADVYRCKDISGKSMYQSSPCKGEGTSKAKISASKSTNAAKPSYKEAEEIFDGMMRLSRVGQHAYKMQLLSSDEKIKPTCYFLSGKPASVGATTTSNGHKFRCENTAQAWITYPLWRSLRMIQYCEGAPEDEHCGRSDFGLTERVIDKK